MVVNFDTQTALDVANGRITWEELVQDFGGRRAKHIQEMADRIVSGAKRERDWLATRGGAEP